jgi:hypothetical protein
VTREKQNAKTIRELPADLLSDQKRARLIERALAGEDVFAYRFPLGPWNLWCDGKRHDLEEVA